MVSVNLRLLEEEDYDQFILDNQYAFKYGALEEFGVRDEHYEEEGEIISRKTIEESIANGTAYRIIYDGTIAGGVVVMVKGNVGHLDLLFVNPDFHSKGIGYAAWCAIERIYPEVTKWETFTPYFETRNIHFYVNRCGFHIVEFFNRFHPDPHDPETGGINDYSESEEFDGMFRFEKVIKR